MKIVIQWDDLILGRFDWLFSILYRIEKLSGRDDVNLRVRGKHVEQIIENLVDKYKRAESSVKAIIRLEICKEINLMYKYAKIYRFEGQFVKYNI